jgi:hypothetical protein
MRKCFLLALIAGAMFAVGAPTASVAAESCHRHTSDSPECVCPPGTDNAAYCVRATPRETAEACDAAAVKAVDVIKSTTTSVTFSFTAGVTGECHLTLLFADPGSGRPHHPLKYEIVGQAVIHTTAGLTSSATVSLNATGLAILAHDAPGHLTQLFEVVVNQVTPTGSAAVHTFGSFVV